eukprot:8965963-Alexandrium_andersonii.AAC.1
MVVNQPLAAIRPALTYSSKRATPMLAVAFADACSNSEQLHAFPVHGSYHPPHPPTSTTGVRW